MRKKLFTFLLAIGTSIGLTHAEVYSGTCGDNLTWELNTEDSTLTISGSGAMKDYYDFSSVPWYSHSSYINSVIINSGVTSIGASAFNHCDKLTSITIPNTITSIGTEAFVYCWNLTSIVIPNSVTNIGGSAFRSCSRLTSIEISNSVTSIRNELFKYCTSLTSVTIPNSVTSIGNEAFYDCSSLKSITIPNSVTSIGWCPFEGCSSLISPVYNNHVFAYLPASFSGTYAIPEGIESVAAGVFSACTNLTSVIIPNSMTSIGRRVFYECKSLTSVTIPNSVTSIEDEAFYGCSSLASIEIPENLTIIGKGAFSRCSSLTSITIPSGVTSIGYYTFSYCTALLDLRIPKEVTSIEYNAFDYVPNVYYFGTDTESRWGAKCINGYVEGLFVYTNDTKKGLEACSSAITGRVIIPKGVSSIKEAAFYNCSQITSLVIPQGVSSIEEYAFGKCAQVTSITLPSTVSSISQLAFSDCNNLKRLYSCKTTPPSRSGRSGFGFPQGITIYVPMGSKDAYQNAEYWKYGNIIEMDAISSNQVVGTTSCSLELNHNFWELDTLFIASVGIEGGEQTAGNVLEYIGLEPNSEYNDVPVVLTANTGETETVNVSFTTTALELTTKASKPVSATTAILLAETNMSDAEVSCGFEYKRNDAPEDMAGTKVFCPVASGQMAGRLKNLKDDVYYKYRAFYQSAAGKMYYGDWQYIFTGDVAVEFDPVLYTYGATVVRENEATISGYALAGATDFTEQGFEYWAESRATEPATMSLRKMKNALGEHFFVPASGISMRVTLTDLDAGTIYKYRAYGKVGDQVYYGAEQTFTTRGKYVAPSYLITFVNWDGTELQKSQVATGTIPEYTGETPVRPGDDQYTYTFKGWTPELAEVTEDAVYTAEFTAEEATAILHIESDQVQCTKILRDGQILILRGDKTYTLTGAEVR